MANLCIVFMGTPAFAVPSLEILFAHHYNVVAVVTAPDKPKGRGQKVMPSPIKEVAQQYHLPILQPTNLKDPSFIQTLESYQANLQVVVAFRMLPQVVWAMPVLGTFNLHASLLPQYRGAAPLHWAIINGEQETGVTTFLLEQAIDTGNIIFQEKEPIYENDTAGTLYERLMHKGAQLVLYTVKAIEQGTHRPIAQASIEAGLLKKAPKIYKKDCQIDWHQPSEAIRNFVRGLAPSPTAWTTWGGKHFNILQVEKAGATKSNLQPGEISSDRKHYLHIGTKDDVLAIKTLQLAGKKPMDIQTFLRGNKL